MNFLTILLISSVILGISMLAMSVRLIFVKNGRFVNSSVGHNKHMKQRGIKCAKSEELRQFGKCSDCGCS